MRYAFLERVRFDVMPLDLSTPNSATEGIRRMPEPSPMAAASHLQAFERAYEQAWLPVFRFALAWTNDWSAAEDLAQESFLRLWDRRAKVEWSTPVLPWLLVTTRRLATDRFRRLRRTLNLRGPVAMAPDMTQRLEWIDLKAAFGGLSPLERAALVLTAIEDLDASAAGEILGIRANSVRSAVSRARRKLKEQR